MGKISKVLVSVAGALLVNAPILAYDATAAPAMAERPPATVDGVANPSTDRDYQRGYREGYRDGRQRAHDECKPRERLYHGHRGHRARDDYADGYDDGYERGYERGFAEYCD